MRPDFARHDRVAGLLRRELATLIWAEINDPRLGPLSVSDVVVTRDLAHAKVFVTSSEPETMPDTLKVLKKAAGFLRSRLGKTLKIRHIPELHFNHDDSIEKGAHMDALIERAIGDSKNPGADKPE